MSMGKSLVTVIGGGIFGCTTALELSAKGFDVNLFELNGHDYIDINKKFSTFKKDNVPKVIIARTKRNFGITSIQNKKEFWYVDKSEKKLKQFKIKAI